MSNQDDWDGTERRVSWDDQIRQAAVFVAAEQQVAEDRKSDVKRAARNAGWRSFFITLLLLIPCVWYIGHVLTVDSRHNARANCDVTSASRPVGNARNFGSSEILPTADDAFRLFPAKFQAREIKRINGDLQTLRRQHVPMPADAPRSIKQFRDLKAFFDYLPPIICSTVVNK